MRIIIPLEPIAASRPRVTRYRTYFADPYNTYRKALKRELRRIMAEHEKVTGPVIAYVEFRKTRPGHPTYEYPSRGDGDNFEKGLYDGCNEVLWEDDRHLLGATWGKTWAEPGAAGCLLMHIESIDPIEHRSGWLEYWLETADGNSS